MRPEWIDLNGHMNLAYYVVVFDDATDALFNAIGLGTEYKHRTGHGTFAVETHTLYERELLLGEAVQVTTHVLAADSKRLHLAHEMFHTATGARSAMQEIMFLHVDLGARRVTPFPVDLTQTLVAAVAAHAAVPRPAGLGRRVAMPG